MTTPTYRINDTFDLFDYFAVVRKQPTPYPADLLAATRRSFVAMLQEAEQRELSADDHASLLYGDYDLGTRCIISGGEVMEIDAHAPEPDDLDPLDTDLGGMC